MAYLCGLCDIRHGIPWLGPEGAEGDGTAYQSHLEIIANSGVVICTSKCADRGLYCWL